jgi:hypothetical protein
LGSRSLGLVRGQGRDRADGRDAGPVLAGKGGARWEQGSSQPCAGLTFSWPMTPHMQSMLAPALLAMIITVVQPCIEYPARNISEPASTSRNLRAEESERR